MAYVDLNPVRAGLASRPEQSEHTSLRARIDVSREQDELAAGIREAIDTSELLHFERSIRPLMAFSDGIDRPNETNLPIQQTEYFKLVDFTGRVAACGKRRRIDPTLAPTLDRLNLSVDRWIEFSSAFKQHYRAGDLKKIV